MQPPPCPMASPSAPTNDTDGRAGNQSLPGLSLFHGHALEGRFFVNDFVGSGISGCSLDVARESAREGDVAAALARSMQTWNGRGSFMSRKKQQETGAQQTGAGLTGAGAGAGMKDQEEGGGWFKFKWPWESNSNSNSISRDDGAAAINREHARQQTSSSGDLSRGQLSLPRGGDWEGARERTRPLNESERQKVQGFVKELMVKSASAAGSNGGVSSSSRLGQETKIKI